MRQLSATPRVFLFENFLTEAEIAYVLACATDSQWLSARGVTSKTDETGFSFEMPIARDPVLGNLQKRLETTTALRNREGQSFRFRKYATGDSHPPHTDTYQFGAARLTATALICLEDVDSGGETRFEKALPEALVIPQKRGRLIYWFNVMIDGETDPLSYHEGCTLLAGSKTTLTSFIYV